MSDGFETADAPDALRRGRPPKPKTVRMVRDPEFFPAPHEADVHPDEVDNMKRHDWREA